jgi:wyosine [tRNA(Phe)-imidazoG37] synthetase (radical SAM superfamily)
VNEAHYCEWLWHAVTVLCDGNVTCGLDDAFSMRSLGNLKNSSLREIFNGVAVNDLRLKLLNGNRCSMCDLYSRVDQDGLRQLSPSFPYPKRLIVEPTIRCDIRCRNTICEWTNNAAFHFRKEDFMAWWLFCKLVDESGTHIDEIFFFNYGEPMLHPRMLDMFAYARKTNPSLLLYTSTNGQRLSDASVSRIVGDDLLDQICISVAGCDEESYLRYHRGGSFQKAVEGMRRLVNLKKQSGKERPKIHWRYLLFCWNDSDAQIAEARRLQAEIGVDRFTFFLTGRPLEGRSLRRAPGSPGYSSIADTVEYAHGYRADPFADSGLYHPEHDLALGWFSWSCGKAHFELLPADRHINLRLARWKLNGVDLPTVRVRTPWNEVTARVGETVWADNLIKVPSAFAKSPVRVQVEVDKTFVPFHCGFNSDIRELGVMIELSATGMPLPES